MEAELRELLVKYGTSEVHKMLMKIMRDDYHYLRSIFEKKQPATAPSNPILLPEAEAVQPAPIQTIQLQETIVAPAVTDENGVKHLVVQPKKKGADEIFAATQTAREQVQESSVTTDLTEEQTGHPFRDPKAMKQFQTEAEAKKRAELDAQGVTVQSLLTRENLEKWLRVEGLTYAAVARDHVGCPADLVATTAKAFGIQSSNSKRRAVFIAKKKASK